MTLTDFKKEHLDGVCEIEKTCFAVPWSKENLEEQIQNENSHFIVAVDGKNVLGYMGVQIICGDGYVTNIAVLPNYRRQGIAKALIKKSFENKMNFLSLEVRESNFAAISLYNSFGFEKAGERKNFYSSPTENAIIMTKYF